MGGMSHTSQTYSTTIKNKDLFTLISLIAIIIVFPYFETTSIGDILLVCLFSALLISALYEVSDHPRQIAIGILLAIPTLLAAGRMCSETCVAFGL